MSFYINVFLFVFEQVFFNEKLLRKRFKIDQPHSLRVRTYIIRGLNISGVPWFQVNSSQFKSCQGSIRLWESLFVLHVWWEAQWCTAACPRCQQGVAGRSSSNASCRATLLPNRGEKPLHKGTYELVLTFHHVSIIHSP